MTAWRQHRYGGPEAVVDETVAVPAPGPGEVLLRVRATALNAGDVHVMRGDPLLVRPAFGLRRPRVAVRGMDVAGTVVAVGAGAAGFAVGDEVVGELPGGGLASFAVAPAARLVARPAALDPVAAAALPVAGGTAWRAVGAADAAAGLRVLVLGAGGGVGTFTVRLATLRGAEVWATCGARAEGIVAGLGAARTFDHRRVGPGDPALPAGSFDAVVDVAGTAPLAALERLVRPGGTVVLVSGAGGPVLGPVGRMARAALRGLVSRRRFRMIAATADAGILAELVALAGGGELVPVVERTHPLAEARVALAHVDAGHAVGKTVVLG